MLWQYLLNCGPAAPVLGVDPQESFMCPDVQERSQRYYHKSPPVETIQRSSNTEKEIVVHRAMEQ